MASNQTSNFQLSQWEANDEVLRADFNEDNLKIETALTAVKAVTDKAYTTDSGQVVAGSYTGNGTVKRKIELGFTPKAVLVMPQSGELVMYSGTAKAYYYGGLAITGHNAATAAAGSSAWANGSSLVGITEGGFWVNYKESTYTSCCTNESGTVFHYLAVK